MDSKQTLTLEEALKIIAQQQFEIHRKNNEIQNKNNEIQNKNNEIQNKNNEIQNKNNEIRILKERLSLQLANREEGYKNSKKRFTISYDYSRITEDLNSEIMNPTH